MMNENLISLDPQPTRADALKNRTLLLETASRLFAEQGVDAVTMSAIAEAAGVGKGTLYRHFENKMELVRALLGEHDEELQNRVLQRLRAAADPLGNLRWFLAEIVRDVLENKLPLLSGNSSYMSSLEHPAHWWVRQTIRGLLEQGHIPGDLDYMADTLYVMTDVHPLHFLHCNRGYEVERILERLLTTMDSLLAKTD
jgi:AcrR family transcriptional regulator